MYLLQYYDGPQKWPFPQGASAGPYRQFAGLGFYRPNQAMYRGMYSGVSRTLGMGIDFSDPITLLALAEGAFLLWALFKGTRRVSGTIRRYRRRRRARA